MWPATALPLVGYGARHRPEYRRRAFVALSKTSKTDGESRRAGKGAGGLTQQDHANYGSSHVFGRSEPATFAFWRQRRGRQNHLCERGCLGIGGTLSRRLLSSG